MASACALSAATVAALLAPGAASAATQCSGSNIIAAGSTLQKLAQVSVWDPEFNESANATACSGTQGDGKKPTVTYESIGSGAGLEDWGYKGHKFEMGRVAVVATDEPVNPEEKKEIENNETTKLAETVQSIPVLQAAVAIIVHLPANCTATNTIKKSPYPGRLVLDNVTLLKVWTGEINTWKQIDEAEAPVNGDSVSGSGCNTETAITRVVRLDGSGTTHVFKKYLGLISNTKFETEKSETKNWSEISEGAENTVWPKAAHVVKPASTGGGALVAEVAATASSIGYANLADARSNGGFSKPSSSGGPGTAKFWTPIENTGIGTTKVKYADPSTDGDTEPLAEANCAKEKYTNGTGTKFPPKSTADTWNEVTTETKEKNYPICGLTYDMVVSNPKTGAGAYADYPGTSPEEETTAENFLGFALETGAGGGQALIGADHDYEPLPTKLLKEALKGI
jgi:ABC-type phosphate transport system substrate-binding protein